ncbi:hypothetical protein PP761_gp11 [Stenotrophomonas phage Paxi]|uniref:Transmembrane protein n=1 Tax=Stenotrophomonas phage Paxi TaxID=2859653 RepID=A0AAE8BI14_9CAUD|nr:hypothetical protein PP761_gp11 [Stenotrophomonas phage Paxi]QYW01782.1 hypothetical protein CPT_Paxi_011 [Stenotrophomonas phage Paxi]
MADLICALLAGISAVLLLLVITIFETMPLAPMSVRRIVKQSIPLFIVVATTTYILLI